MSFVPDQISEFRFLEQSFNQESGLLELNYGLDDRYRFTERILFPPPHRPPGADQQAALERCLDLVHWLAGMSYYKSCVPPHISFSQRLPRPAVADFLRQVYTHGLAEFAFTNRLRLSDRLRFDSAPGFVATPIQLASGTVVPLGGGKDSLVSCDLLSRSHIPFRTISVGQSPLIERVAKRVPGQHLVIRRRLDPKLMALNRAGAYNGHVPISAILAAIMLAGGLLYGYDTIVMSNERSASEANVLLDDGNAVNHQWSKSLAFEDQFLRQVEREILPGFRYFSLLRGWSEIRIARHFAGLDSFHSIFSSCNRNFTQGGAEPEGRWCNNCPKCRFVALALAPFLSPERLTDIMGKNLLDDDSQLDGFFELAGIHGIKPFECVGEVAESKALLCHLSQTPPWAGMKVPDALAGHVSHSPPLESFLQLSEQHRVPREFMSACI